MNWTEDLANAINYIEDHLLDDITCKDIASNAFISEYYFLKVFSIYTGFTIGEYIRNRRLYQAAVELKSKDDSVTDIAFKYCYETLESFTKAFTRFHGVNPTTCRNTNCEIKVFLPLKINISIIGGENMDYIIEDMDDIKFIGFVKKIKNGDGYTECPNFWDYVNSKYFNHLDDNSIVSKSIKENCVGSFAICYDGDSDNFKYMIGGICKGKDIPKEMEVITIKKSKWAKFKCFGPLPGALQSINTKIYKEWIPNNPKYEISLNCDIEWYSNGNIEADNYKSEIWLPIKEK